MDKIKRYSKYQLVQSGQESPVGSDIYEWEYLDQEGKVKTDKKNVFEEIQSYLPRVDYKTQIARGELSANDSGNTYTDFTGIPNDTVALYDYLNTLANLPQEQVTKLLEQVNSRSEKSVQTEQATNSKTTSGGQTNAKDVQSESSNVKVDQTTIGGEQ